jgi:renalase
VLILLHTLGARGEGDQDSMTRIAIIGAGFSGLVLAHRLRGHADVSLFEAGAQAGGRLASRQIGPYRFDLGAQFFNVWEPELKAFIAAFVSKGSAAVWRARFVEFASGERVWGRQWDEAQPHYVGTPDMAVLAAAMAEGLSIQYRAAITRIESGWTLHFGNGDICGPFDWVISTAPSRESARLLGGLSPAFGPLSEIAMKPCCVGLFGFTEPPDLEWDIAVVRKDMISLMAVNSAKPGRGGAFSLSVLATNAWSTDNLTLPHREILAEIAAAVERITGVDMPSADVQDLQVWQAANAARRGPPHFFLDPALRLAACGDWGRSGIVESAFLSATGLAAAMEKLGV